MKSLHDLAVIGLAGSLAGLLLFLLLPVFVDVDPYSGRLIVFLAIACWLAGMTFVIFLVYLQEASHKKRTISEVLLPAIPLVVVGGIWWALIRYLIAA